MPNEPEPIALLTARRQELRAAYEHFQPELTSWVADLALRALAADAYEQSGATLVLHNAEHQRTSYATARAALEAAIDMMFLVCKAECYIWRGCLARASEALEEADLARRYERAFPEEMSAQMRSVRDGAMALIELDAREWNARTGGRGELLIRAFAWVQDRGRVPGRWAGLTRREMLDRIREGMPSLANTVARIDLDYTKASIQTHPGLRTSYRPIVTDKHGRVSHLYRGEDDEALGIAADAAALSRSAVRIREDQAWRARMQSSATKDCR
jgi:hypothetical protein